MEREIIKVGQVHFPHAVVTIRGNGACLFSALSYLLYGTDVLAEEVRFEIVQYVSSNWDRLHVFSAMPTGETYSNKDLYISEMSRHDTYGTTCELIAAGELFPYLFQVYQSGILIAQFGEEMATPKRLRFTGNFNEGHFDVLEPTSERHGEVPPITYTHTTPSTHVPPVSEPIANSGSKTKQPKRRRVRLTGSIRKQQLKQASEKYRKANPEQAKAATKRYAQTNPHVHRKAVRRYSQKNPEVHREAVRRYDQENPEVNREAVRRYAQENPEVNREAVRRYAQENPEVNREAVRRYAQENPEVNREAVRRYAQENPEVNREAVRRYTQENPEVNRDSVRRYAQENPEVNRQSAARYALRNPRPHRAAVRKYAETHPDINRNAVRRYTERVKAKWVRKINSAFDYNVDVDYSGDKCVSIGTMCNICDWCNAKKWQDECTGMCCNSGKVFLHQLHQPPELILCLLTNSHPESQHFLNNIRQYNGCFQMTSFGAKKIQEGNFMPTFKVQGQVYHRIGSLLPAPQQEPAFLQIYFVGAEDKETDIRCGHFSGVKQNLVSQVQAILHACNPYVRDFKAAIASVPAGEDFQVVIHADRKPPTQHRGRFNAPTAKEVAVVIVGQAFERRDIILRSSDDKLTRISETHRAYDALQYPLMFCHGEDGYTINLPQRDPLTNTILQKTVSAVDFYSFRIVERQGQFNHLLHYRDLFSQFLVDMYAKIETERLNYIRANQTKLRAENYAQLKDAINRGDAQPANIGKMVVLPSTFTGGPRYMHERTQDAMTYVRQWGKPDLFITFTCNPKWTDITENLHELQKPQHRHDLVARVFHLKLKKLIQLLTKAAIFGPVQCYMYTVEWQKRGLPHAHILLWLKEGIKADQIDTVIRAEIPDPDKDPLLHEIIRTNMIHGPCGPFNTNSPCMVNGSCTKRYPRPLLATTQTGDDGYPQYRRRAKDNGGFTVNIRGVDVDNRWVVPYNPVLSRTFIAHINVEYCHSVKSIKYICKYVNKGSDQATFAIEQDNDEVKKYETGRYISSSEAVWRIFCFPIHERFPPVMHLSVHLENGQRVYFTDATALERISDPPKTTLLAFFELCTHDSFARQLLYCEVPSYYIWKDCKFTRRKRGQAVPGHLGIKRDQVIGRVYTVHPNNSECYYLRLLLHEVRGPTSFTFLKTVNGHIYPTFQSACKALGLLEDDTHWDHTLTEAALAESPHRLRQLFAIMLIFCQLSDPNFLWLKHKDSLAEDSIRQAQNNNLAMPVEEQLQYAYNICLIAIEDIVIATSGQSLHHYGLPQPTRTLPSPTNAEYLREVSYDVNALSNVVRTNEPLLTPDQRRLYKAVIGSINSGTGRMFFLDAPGGTGKTFLINLLLAAVRMKRNIAIAVASSGIAATLLDGGKTAHSAFKLPLNLNFVTIPICNIAKQSGTAQILQECKLIVWDECTMSHRGGIEALDRTLQDMRQSKKLMGGATVLLAGDFRQTLPVVPRGTRADEVNACLKSSYLWPKIHRLSLTTNMRVHLQRHPDAEKFAQLLLQLGDGNIQEQGGKIEITDDLCDIVHDVQSLTANIYPDIANIHNKPLSWLKERAILSPKNAKANEINNALINQFDAIQSTYKSIDSVVEMEDAVHYPVEFLHTLNPPGIPAHELTLKVGAPVMLLRNLQPPKLCNGTRIQITALHTNVVEGKIFTGCGQGETVFIPRIPLIPSDYPFQFKRLQFPLKLCFAMTINKAQGQSLKTAGIDLRDDCFSHGQLYVACSRVSSPRSLTILQPHHKTTNVVYKEVLRS